MESKLLWYYNLKGGSWRLGTLKEYLFSIYWVLDWMFSVVKIKWKGNICICIFLILELGII